jgi:ElaB/YqjD/DUF883 family membrane-anchored ribosome-binding protein
MVADKERSEHMAMTTEENRSGEIDRIKSDLQELRDGLGKLLGHIGSYSKGKLGSTREKVSAAVEDVGGRAYDRFQGTGHQVTERSRQALDVSRDAVQHKPLTYVAVAFVAGMILASLLEWKRS